MFSYFIYNTVLLMVCCFGFLVEKGKTPQLRFISRGIVFLSLFIPAAIRYGIGTDYFNYVEIFNNLDTMAKELGWTILNKVVINVGLSYQWIFVLSSILIYFPIAFHIKRKYYFITLVLYILLTFYFKSYNIIRQSIAVSFLISTIFFMDKKKFGKALFFFCLAYSFHQSAILFIPAYMICKIPYKNRYLPVLVICIGLFVLLKYNLFKIILDILSLIGSKYAVYANITCYLEKTPINTGVGILIALSPVIIVILTSSRILLYDKKNSFYVNLSIVYLFSFLLTAQFMILGRLRDLYMFIPLITYGYGINACGKYKKIINIFICALLLFSFEINIQKQSKLTYSNTIYPYTTIFNK